MWNCDWEYENQETLRQWYEEKISGERPYSAVRRIICKGCGRIFYTQISTKKYCYYAKGTIRISFGKANTEDDVEAVFKALMKIFRT